MALIHQPTNGMTNDSMSTLTGMATDIISTPTNGKSTTLKSPKSGYTDDGSIIG